MNEERLEFLIQIGDFDQGNVGHNPFNWAAHVLNDVIDDELNQIFNRHNLLEYCANGGNNDLNVLIAILAWGGMRRDHGSELLNNRNTVLELVNNLRNGIYLTRHSAFEAFRVHRANGLLPGLGIGYFTKLICFLSPNLNGYIMDQWVGKSINFLTGEIVVSITGTGWVNDHNTADTYEIFCTHIDNLAIILACTGSEAEKRIFSVGRGQGEWRNYLIANYHN